MARYSRTQELKVVFNGRHVGDLQRSSNGAITFTYALSWLLMNEKSMPISLSMPLREEKYSGVEVSYFFENLLPDDDAIKRVVAQTNGADGIDAFSLLSKIGRDCVGALQFVFDLEEAIPTADPQFQPLNRVEVLEIINNLAVAPLGMNREKDRGFRVSIAGVQQKTALYWNGGWCLPIGNTPTTHIIKPAIGLLPNGLDLSQSVENEHFCLSLFRHFGMPVADNEIVELGDVKVLAVKRFDRIRSKDGRLLRVPQEDFCQALSYPSTRKYNADNGPGIKECMDLLVGSDLAESDRYLFMKAQILFWLIGATDGHAKNFSLFLNAKGRYRMTPLYDIISLQPNYDARQLSKKGYKLAMCMGKSRKYKIDEIMLRHIMQSAAMTSLSQEVVTEMIESIAKQADSAIEATLNERSQNFNYSLVESISNGLKQRLKRIMS